MPTGSARFPSLAWALLGLALALPRASAQQAERYALPSDRAAVYDLAGEIRVEPGSGTDVVVMVTRGGRDAGRLRIERGPISESETLRVVFPEDQIVYPQLSRGSGTNLRVRDDGTFGDGRRPGGRRGAREGREVAIRGSGPGLEAHADLTISIPPGSRLALHLGVGKATLSNINGEIVVDAASAPVTAQAIGGSLAVNVGSGAVSVTDAQGDLGINTGSGGVELARIHAKTLSVETGSGRVNATDVTADRASLETGSGDISLTHVGGADLHLEAGSGDIDVDLATDVRALRVETGSGSVVLRVPEGLGAEIDIETGSGGIETDVPVEVRRFAKDHLSGRIGDGDGRIDVETGSGRVRLLRRAP